MNYKMVLSIIGKVMVIEAVLMLLPLTVGIIYSESVYFAFLLPIALLTAID